MVWPTDETIRSVETTVQSLCNVSGLGATLPYHILSATYRREAYLRRKLLSNTEVLLWSGTLGYAVPLTFDARNCSNLLGQ